MLAEIMTCYVCGYQSSEWCSVNDSPKMCLRCGKAAWALTKYSPLRERREMGDDDVL